MKKKELILDHFFIQVKDFIALEIDERKKAKRMKMEMKFARDSSTTLPKSDPIFRIQVTLPNKVCLDNPFGVSH